MKKREILFIIVLLAVGLFSVFFTEKQEGSLVRITVDGKEYRTIPLDQEETISILQGENHNVVRIEQQQVYMEAANCPDGLCMKQGKIAMGKQMIVCLPHRVVVEILSGQTANGIDTVAQ